MKFIIFAVWLFVVFIVLSLCKAASIGDREIEKFERQNKLWKKSKNHYYPFCFPNRLICILRLYVTSKKGFRN